MAAGENAADKLKGMFKGGSVNHPSQSYLQPTLP